MFYEGLVQNRDFNEGYSESGSSEKNLELVKGTREKLTIPTIDSWDSFYEYIYNLGEVVLGGNQINDAESFIDLLERTKKNILNNPPDLVKDEEVIRYFDVCYLAHKDKGAFIEAYRGKILKNSPYLIKVINHLGSAKSSVIRNVFSTLIMNDLEAMRGNINDVNNIRKNFVMHVISNET